MTAKYEVVLAIDSAISNNVHLQRAFNEEGPAREKRVQIDHSDNEHVRALAQKSATSAAKNSSKEPSVAEVTEQLTLRLEQLEKSTGKRFPAPLKKLLVSTARFTKNDDVTRLLTMANELAEGIEPSLASLAPAFRKPAYVFLWAATIGYAAMRTVNVGLLGGGTEMLRDTVHQFFAGITIPTFVVRAANKIQNLLFDKTIGRDGINGTITDLVRPAVSLSLGSKAVHFMDHFLDKHLKNYFGKLSHASRDKLDDTVSSLASIFTSLLPKNREAIS